MALPAQAQWTICKDSARYNPMFQCNDVFYNPVCGCDGITYRNQCVAYNMYGVLEWRSGVCSGLDIDFLPNPVGPFSPLTVNLSYPEFVYGSAVLRIVDMFGKTWEQRMINNFNRTSLQIDVSGLRTGLYLLVLTGDQGVSAVRRLAKF